jgi:hypothetical protein
MTDTLQTGERRRRPQHQDSNPAEPSIAIVHEDLYAVLATRETMGFVERVGNVFVALHGPDLARAVEVGQSLSWDQCVSMVRRAWAR